MSLRCLASNCSQFRRPKQIFCIACWLLVPRSLQDQVYATFGNGFSGDFVRALRDARAAVTAFSTPRPSGQTLRQQ